MVLRNILYVERDVEGSSDLIEAVKNRVKELGITSVVVASTNGKSAIKLADALKAAAKVISITEFAYDDEVKNSMKKTGVVAIERAELPIQDRREMREALLFFGGGVKAALEVAAVAAGKGVVPSDKLVAVAGSGRSLDTALVVKPAPPSDFFSPDPSKHMSVLEIIAMPLKE